MRDLSTTAAALLSILSTVASLSPQSHQRGSPVITSAFPRMVNSNGSNISQQRLSRRRRPPLVDSDLLRFLSRTSQPLKSPLPRKNITSTTQEQLSNDVNASVNTATLDANCFNDDRSIMATTTNTLSISSSSTTTFSSSSLFDMETYNWVESFSRYRVASLLGDSNVAWRAAEKIEQMAIARAARRRVRLYWKEREKVWDKYNNTLSINNIPSNNGTTMTVTAVDKDDIILPILDIQQTNFEQVLNLMLEYGLSRKDCAEIFNHSPGVAFLRARDPKKQSTLQESLDRVFVGMLMGRSETWHLRLRKYDARKILRDTPGLLSTRGSQSAVQVVQLLTRLDVSTNSLTRDKNALPLLLSRQPSAIFRLVAFLSSEDVRMPLHKIGPLLRRPECQDLLNTVAPAPRLQNSINGGSYDPVQAQVRREVINNHYRKMSRTAWIMRHEIGTQDLGRVIAAYPSVLLLDAARQILPVAHYFMDDLGIWSDDLPRVFQLFPSLLRLDVEPMRNIVNYLVSLGVEKENLGMIFRSFPALLTLDVEHDMEPVVDFLRCTVGIANVGRFITRLPPILGYSVDKELRPKYNFLASVTTDPRFEASKFPAFFSYPLERTKTRFAYLHEMKGVPTALVALDKVLCYGDRDFATRIAGDRDDGISFQEFVIGRRQRLMISRNATMPKKKPSLQFNDYNPSNPETDFSPTAYGAVQ